MWKSNELSGGKRGANFAPSYPRSQQHQYRFREPLPHASSHSLTASYGPAHLHPGQSQERRPYWGMREHDDERFALACSLAERMEGTIQETVCSARLVLALDAVFVLAIMSLLVAWPVMVVRLAAIVVSGFLLVSTLFAAYAMLASASHPRLLLAGTPDGRRLFSWLFRNRIPHLQQPSFEENFRQATKEDILKGCLDAFYLRDRTRRRIRHALLWGAGTLVAALVVGAAAVLVLGLGL